MEQVAWFLALLMGMIVAPLLLWSRRERRRRRDVPSSPETPEEVAFCSPAQFFFRQQASNFSTITELMFGVCEHRFRAMRSFPLCLLEGGDGYQEVQVA